jgi:mannose/fructose/N-acetylgalactosamine-specific phosphotransferase system component IIC
LSAGTLALTTALVYLAFSELSAFWAHNFATRPIVVCPILGIILGDAATGLALGASLELLFMGITNIGGSIPSDVFLAGTIVTALCIGTGLDYETAVVLAAAIGAVSAIWSLAVRIIYQGMFVSIFERLAAKGDVKGYNRMAFIANVTNPIFSTLLVYVAIALGADALQGIIDSIPAFILNGLKVAAGMMPAIGLGLLMNMLWSGKASIYFFFGFAATVYLNINMTFMVVIAVFITLMQVYNELDLRERLKAVGGGSNGGEDDLFG